MLLYFPPLQQEGKAAYYQQKSANAGILSFPEYQPYPIFLDSFNMLMAFWLNIRDDDIASTVVREQS